MGRSVSRGALRLRSLKLANVENDPSFDQAGVDALINLHMPAVYDFLVAAGPADYYASDEDIDVLAGIVPYDLPTDFMQLVNVYVVEPNEFLRPLDDMQGRERQFYKGPAQDGTVRIEYIPTCPVFDDDADEFDGVDGWDELITAKVARDILTQREGDITAVMSTIAGAERRIRTFSTQRKRGGSKRINDVEMDVGWPLSTQIHAYRLRADNLEIFSSLWGPFG